MSSNFSSFQLQDPALFGIRLSGVFGRTAKQRLQELTTKCIAKRRIKLILDLSQLETIGGGGAGVLADLQRQLQAQGGEVVFVGVNQTVKRFLSAKFTDLPLRICETPAAAEAAFASDVNAGHPAGVPDPPAPDRGEASCSADAVAAKPRVVPSRQNDGALDELLGSFLHEDDEAASASESTQADDDPVPAGLADRVLDEVLASHQKAAAPELPPERNEDPHCPSSGSPSPDAADGQCDRGATSEFISLEEAVKSLRRAKSTAEMCHALSRLLHSHDLAAEVILCQRQEQQLVEAQGRFRFDLRTAFTEHLLAKRSPVLLLDLPVEGLAEPELRQLEEIDPDLILPLVWQEELQAIAFLHHGKQGHEYGISDHLALEMLMHLLAENGDRTRDDVTSASAPPAEDLPPLEVGLALSERIFAAEDEPQLWQRLHAVMAEECGVKSMIHFDPEQDQFGPPVCLGMSRSMIPQLNLREGKQRAYFARQRRLLSVMDLPDDLRELRDSLSATGMTLLVPLHSKRQWLGVLILAEAAAGAPPRIGREQLSGLCGCATLALEKLRGRQGLEECNLGVVQTLMSLLEKRLHGSRCPADLLARRVRQLGRGVDFPAGLERDLIYGALLRDIGMIPLGDLVLDSPQTMTREQWQQFRAHPTEGARMLEALPVSGTVKDVVLYHHEKFKGDGYPCGLKGREIPLAARIVAVAENYVEMYANLPNRDRAEQHARAILLEDLEGRMDPVLVEVFVRLLEREEQAERHRAAQLAGV